MGGASYLTYLPLPLPWVLTRGVGQCSSYQYCVLLSAHSGTNAIGWCLVSIKYKLQVIPTFTIFKHKRAHLYYYSTVLTFAFADIGFIILPDCLKHNH